MDMFFLLRTVILVIIIINFFSIWACKQEEEKKVKIEKSAFGETEEGKLVHLYTLTNKNGVEVQITNYGAIVVSLKVPDRHGKFGDVVFGYDNLDDYIKDKSYFGAIVGRYGNRIAKLITCCSVRSCNLCNATRRWWNIIISYCTGFSLAFFKYTITTYGS